MYSISGDIAWKFIFHNQSQLKGKPPDQCLLRHTGMYVNHAKGRADYFLTGLYRQRNSTIWHEQAPSHVIYIDYKQT